jgi:hypothetical protein
MPSKFKLIKIGPKNAQSTVQLFFSCHPKKTKKIPIQGTFQKHEHDQGTVEIEFLATSNGRLSAMQVDKKICPIPRRNSPGNGA